MGGDDEYKNLQQLTIDTINQTFSICLKKYYPKTCRENYFNNVSKKTTVCNQGEMLITCIVLDTPFGRNDLAVDHIISLLLTMLYVPTKHGYIRNTLI